MSLDCTYRFEELPLFRDAEGFEDHGVSGEAVILIDRDGELSVEDIDLDGHRRSANGYSYEHKRISLPKTHPLFSIISERILADTTVEERAAEVMAEDACVGDADYWLDARVA